MFSLYDLLFIAIFFIVMLIIGSSYYFKKLTGSNIGKSLIVSIVVWVTILIVNYVISAINSALGATEISYIAGLWSGFATSKYFWENNINSSSILNFNAITLILTILIFNLIKLLVP